MSFAVGSLVKARGREWVVLPESAEDLLVLRPLGGTEDEVTGIYLPLEPVEPATFALPDPSQPGDYRSCRLLRDAVRLGFRSSAGPFRAFARIAVEPRPYQLVPLLLALRLDPVRMLIADDVGVGKTIEACLIARELLDRGEIERLAVLCSPQLAPQWQNELRDKFHIDAEIVLPGTVTRLERNCRLNQSIFDLYPHVIVSTDFIKADRRRDEFLRACPEMVIVDEAHTCAYGYDNRGGRHQRYQLVSQLATHPERHVILVTATPHSGNEAAFRSLLGMLHVDFANLPEDLSGRENESHRRRLAAHFVQRRRADIRRYLDIDTVFPERQEAEDTYRLSPDYKRLFERVLNYARETVSDTGGTLHRQRVRWWSALALLRSLASSPAAAVATLRTRAASADTETAEEADAIGRQTVLDLQADEMVESLDLTPGSDLGDASDEEQRTRRRLLDMAREAEKLLGTRDEKLKKAVSLIDAFIHDGFNPIVFCRFIPTAEYVAEELRKKLRNVEVAAVTGTLPPDERDARVAQLAQADRRVLVCTDCLSEGINLQEHFDAVMHYDLSWNPTRHEQREGRVDRYGQPSRTVRVLTFYGLDNQIDGIVLDVLIRKHKTIRNSLGISVPVPVDTNQVVEAIFEGLLLRGPSGTSVEQMLLFEEFFTPQREDLYGKWDAVTEREKRSRTMFAQETIKVDDVARELQAVRAAIGSGLNVETFTMDALRAHGAVIAERGSREWGVGSGGQNTERRIEMQRDDDRIVSRSTNLEAGDGNSSGMLPADTQLSERRTLRSDFANPQSLLFDSEQHCGGLREGKYEGLHSVPPNLPGQSKRDRDTPDPISKSQSQHQSTNSSDIGKVQTTGENAAHLDSITPEEIEGSGVEPKKSSEGASPHSPLPTPYSPLPTPHSPLPTPYSPLEQAILSLKICDPACGSGHFLIAAAHRLAKHLASVRTGDDEPAPEAVRTGLRDVIGHCVYGVDINPMAVELCKVSLWMEALEPGKPLSFLDHRIQCGNSLIGATPALLKHGILDDAFKPIEGDDKTVCSEYRRQNKQEREGQLRLFAHAPEPWQRLGNLATGLLQLEEISDDSITGVRRKQERWEQLVRSQGYIYSRLWADAWCAAFVWRKIRDHNHPYPITEELFRKIERNPFHVVNTWHEQEIRRLAEQYQFFHWHLAFPDVFRVPTGNEEPENERAGWNGGFDVVLGNPPWDRIKLQEKEWFATRRPEIANAPNAAARRRMIEALRSEDTALYEAFLDDRRKAEGESHFVRSGDHYPLCGRGDVNTYAIFAEMNRMLINDAGRLGCIAPSGIATDDTTKEFFQELVEKKSLVSLYDFQSGPGLFGDIGHARFKFCLLTLSGLAELHSKGAEFAFFLRDVNHLQEPMRRFRLTAQEIALLNPNTRTCPIFRSKRDAELTKAIYTCVPVLVNENKSDGNPWGIKFATLFHLANDSGLFRTHEQLEAEGWQLCGNSFCQDERRYLPLYEAKMLHHFNHRFGDYAYYPDGALTTQLPDVPYESLQNPNYVILPRYWVPESEVAERLHDKWNRHWLLGWRDITNATNERTVIASMMPMMGVGHKFPLLIPENVATHQLVCLYANLCCFVLDYVARQKMGGTSLTYFYLKQFPILPPSTYAQTCLWSRVQTLREWLLPRVLELTYTAYDLQPFAIDCGYSGPPFRWDEERRFLLRCELDAAYFHLYGIGRDDVDYILETFPIVKRKAEQAHGEYRTKRVILDIYDAMQQAMETDTPYHTRLDPPPAHGWTPPEITLEVATGQQSDGAKEDTEVNASNDFQRCVESVVSQTTLHFEDTE